MYLYLVRHGIAVPRDGAEVTDDAVRPLTERGAERFRCCVRGLKRLGIELQEIWTSPLVRAEETAKILSEGFPEAKLRTERNLAPGGDLSVLLKRLYTHRTREGIALVGHEPDLSEFCASLISGKRGPGIRLKKGGVVCLEVDDLNPPVRGELCWLLTPSQMRSLK